VPEFCDGLPNRDNDANCDMWDRKEPNNFLGREECVRAGTNGRWNDADCTRKHAFACYYLGTSTTWVTSTTTWATTTTTFATTTTTFATTTTTAEPTTTTTAEPPLWAPDSKDGWSNLGSCYYKHFDTKTSWIKAGQQCSTAMVDLDGNGAWLASPQSEEEARFIARLGKTAKPRWTSGMAQPGETKFTYEAGDWNADFSVDDWNGWYNGEPNMNSKDGRCAAQGYNKKNLDVSPWKMNDASCDLDNMYVCQWCLKTTTTTPPTTSTTTFQTSTTTWQTTTTEAPTTYELPSDADWEYSDHTQCYYKEFDEKVAYNTARSRCQSAHVAGGSTSHLATISSEAEAMFVSGGPGRPRWVGTYKTKKGEWKNVDASFFSMKLFYSGEPNGGHMNAQMGYRKKKDDIFPWKLNDVPEDTRNPYVCEWCPPELSTSTTTEAPSTTTTEAPSTTTTTEAPSTTTAEPGATPRKTTRKTTTATEEPCVAGSAGLTAEMHDTDVLAKHIESIAQMNTRMDNRLSGKTFPVKWTCPEFCAGLAWGPSCAPCGLSSLKTKASCLFSGPFLTGELCHRNFKTGEVTDEPCCNLETREPIDGYKIAEASTCVIGNNCNCKKWGPVDSEDVHGKQRNLNKFEASYLYTLPRKFEDGVCTEL